MFSVISYVVDCFVPDESSSYFVLKPGLLQQGAEYRVRLTVTTSANAGYSEYLILTNLPPYGGRCSVEPNRGEDHEPLFEVCLAF